MPKRTKKYRSPRDVSPKVSVPSAITAAVAVVWGLLNGVEYDAEQLILVGAALAQFVIGYLKADEA